VAGGGDGPAGAVTASPARSDARSPRPAPPVRRRVEPLAVAARPAATPRAIAGPAAPARPTAAPARPTAGPIAGPAAPAGLAAWYAAEGRHHLPWRRTRDPWRVLVSEVMLQQTPVSRVLPRWERFVERWPVPESCAAATLDDVLREWDGLGYPRRAVALWRCAAIVAGSGWPRDEPGLRTLPGIGVYTARALLTLAFGEPSPPARDVNLTRVAARCFLGAESAPPRALDQALVAARPAAMGAREWTLALFDVGALLCRRRAVRCERCPLAAGCRSRQRLEGGVPPAPRRQPAYPGSMRQLRGAVLRAMLACPDLAAPDLEHRVAHLPAARRPGAVAEALWGLRRDGLIPGAAR
jgi:A/G-specific adenine glycosylase